MGVAPNDKIDLHDPSTMNKMVNAIVAQEGKGGAAPLTPGQQALASGRPDYPTALARLRDDPSINPIERRQAMNELHSEYSFDFQMEERMVQQAEKNRKELETANEALLFSKAVMKEPLDQKVLANMLASRQITPAGYNAIMAESNREEKGIDRQPETVDLWRRIGAGEDVKPEIYTSIGERTLSGPTADAMMKSISERQKTQANQVERSAFSTLRTVAGMDATEHPMVDLGRDANAAQVALWAQAQTEWNQRVLVQKEDPSAVLADMTPRYGHPVKSIQALPRPRLGMISKPEDVGDVAQKTQAAMDAGQLTPDQFRNEQALILQYQGLLDARQRQTDAAKAAIPPRSGGARPVGVRPEGQ
jgi:hypothetical protein